MVRSLLQAHGFDPSVVRPHDTEYTLLDRWDMATRKVWAVVRLGDMESGNHDNSDKPSKELEGASLLQSTWHNEG